MQKFTWNYPALRGMDVFFTSAQVTFLGSVIRIEEEGIGHAFDTKIPTHCGLISQDRGQFFATEETARGLVENSLETYCGWNEQVISVLRWDRFDSDMLRNAALDSLALIRRKRKEYDYLTLLTFPKFLRWIRPLIGKKTDSDEKEICSETVYRRLREAGMQCEIGEYDIFPPSPNSLYDYLLKRGDFKKVNFKL